MEEEKEKEKDGTKEIWAIGYIARMSSMTQSSALTLITKCWTITTSTNGHGLLKNGGSINRDSLGMAGSLSQWLPLWEQSNSSFLILNPTSIMLHGGTMRGQFQ